MSMKLPPALLALIETGTYKKSAPPLTEVGPGPALKRLNDAEAELQGAMKEAVRATIHDRSQEVILLRMLKSLKADVEAEIENLRVGTSGIEKSFGRK
jgi:hypothetical protein